MRAVLIDWLVEISVKFKLNQETIYLTVNLVDRYLSKNEIEKTRLQLLGIAAMLIASKFEEIYAPEVRDFVYICDRTYSKAEILNMEYEMLSSLDFNILTVYPYTFLVRFHFASGHDMRSFYLAQYILESSFLEFKMLRHKSSTKAATSLYLARKLIKAEPAWNKDLQIVSNYSDKELHPCLKDICFVLDNMPKLTLKACFNKFSTDRYMNVSKII